MLDEARAGGRDARRAGDPRAHERQPLPLRRLPQHRRRDRGHRRVKAFAYERASDAAAAVAAGADGATFLGGGTNLVDLMKLGVAEPRPAGRRLAAPARRDRGDGRRRLRIGAAVRNADLAAHPLIRERYPLLSAGAARRRLGPAAQPRHRRRQPAPAHPLRVLPGRHEALQQAPPRLGLPGARGRAPQPRDPRPLRALRRHAPERHGGRARRDRRRASQVLGANGERTIPIPGLHRLPGDEAAARHRARTRRPDHRGRARRARAALASTARSATARPSRSRCSPSPPRSTWRRRTSQRRAGSRSAASPTCRGEPSGPRPCCAAPRRRPEAFAAAADAELDACAAAARQRLQGAVGPQRARPHARGADA